jgi:Ribbon-helix-helix protein, copG family
MRILVDVPENELEALNSLSASKSVSRAELVRQAVKAFVDANRSAPALDGFGLWKSKGIDTDEYLRKIRAEWDRDWDAIEAEPRSSVAAQK